MSIKTINDQHIILEKQRLSKKFGRNAWLRNGMSLAAAGAACWMLMAWSKGEIKYSFKDEYADQKAFLEYFNHLDDKTKYDYLIAQVREPESFFSWRSITQKVLPYALGTASSTLIFNMLQTLVMQPFVKVMNNVYYNVSLQWFLTSQTNIHELFDALEATAAAFDSDKIYHEAMFADLMNSLVWQIERALGFMYYEYEAFIIPNTLMRSLGQTCCSRLKETCIDSINIMNSGYSDGTIDGVALGSLLRLKGEFEVATKQFQSFEAACN